MRSGVLIALIILVLSGYGVYRFYSQPVAPFSGTLIKVDTAQVTSILLETPPNRIEIALLRETTGWIASNGQTNIKASDAIVNSLLQALSDVKIKEVVATKAAAWTTFGVDDKQGVHVRVYEGKKLLDDLIIGKSDTDPTSGQPISYLRLSEEEEVFAVYGELALAFSQDFRAFRNRLLLQLTPDMHITMLEFETPDTLVKWTQTPAGWAAGTTILDSVSMAQYLRKLTQINGEIFADDFDEVQGSKYLYQVLKISGEYIELPFVITCYRDTTRNPPFIIHSNQNKEAFFASDSVGIYNTIFGKVNDFNKIVKRDTTSLR